MKWLLPFVQVLILVTGSLVNDVPQNPMTARLPNLGCGYPWTLDNKTVQQLVGPHDSQYGMGAASLFGNEKQGGPKPWPRQFWTNKVVIPYCYNSPAAREHLSDRVDKAIQIWYDALGGKASKESSHGLEIAEWYDLDGPKPPPPMYCFQSSAKNGRNWNEKLVYATVSIVVDEKIGIGGNSPIGYHEIAPAQPWLNQMFLGPDIPIAAVAHEWGHVLGMVHEHMRTYRDRYVEYRCHLVKGFDQALDEAKQQGIGWEELCTDIQTAYKFGFDGAQYMIEPWKKYIIKPETDYDVSSLMHYSSSAFASPECTANNLDECPLVAYKDPTKHNRGVTFITAPVAPSEGDVKFTKQVYPFEPAWGTIPPPAKSNDNETEEGWGGVILDGKLYAIPLDSPLAPKRVI